MTPLINHDHDTDNISEPTKSYTDIRAQWKARAALQNISSSDIAIYCIYRSLISDTGLAGAIQRLHKSFTPISNRVKLDNGAKPFGALQSALWSHSVIYEWVTLEEKQEILSICRLVTISGKEIK